jgi:hypothetical protein
MVKDRRYNRVKKLLLAGYITGFRELFDHIPKTLVGKDLGMHNQTFSKLLDRPENFTLLNISRIAALFEVEEKIIIDLIYTECAINRRLKNER